MLSNIFSQLSGILVVPAGCLVSTEPGTSAATQVRCSLFLTAACCGIFKLSLISVPLDCWTWFSWSQQRMTTQGSKCFQLTRTCHVSSKMFESEWLRTQVLFWLELMFSCRILCFVVIKPQMQNTWYFSENRSICLINWQKYYQKSKRGFLWGLNPQQINNQAS